VLTGADELKYPLQCANQILQDTYLHAAQSPSLNSTLTPQEVTHLGCIFNCVGDSLRQNTLWTNQQARWCAGPQFLRQAHRHARGLEGPTETCKASAHSRAKPYASECPVGLRVRTNHLDVQPQNQDFWCHRREWGSFMCSVCVLSIRRSTAMGSRLGEYKGNH
jgi:hypothetical protein